MNRISLFIFFTLTFDISSSSQTLRRSVAANYIGLGAYSTHHQDLFSFTANQAALAQLKHTSAGINGEKRFLLSELNNFNAVFGLPTSTGNFGLNTGYYGFSDCNETQLGLAYGRILGNKIDIGAQFNYSGIRIAGYGRSSAISFEAGAILHLTDRLHAGIHIDNPLGGRFGMDHQEKLSSSYTLGFGYDASQKFFLGIEMEKEEDWPVNVNLGLQYKFLPQVLARAGINSASSMAYMAIGLSWQSLRIDVISSYHPQLGITPGLLLLFNFKGKTD